MRLPCELIVRELLPAIRAEIVKLLVNKYKMKQEDVADILSIKQSTVSRYITGMRGSDDKLPTRFPEIQRYIETTTEEIHREKFSKISIHFCDLCLELRGKPEFCDFHKEFSHISDCEICFVGPPNYVKP
ncbi:MAG: transcriptional regulator [Candidatus Sifarchaeia archaeon]